LLRGSEAVVVSAVGAEVLVWRETPWIWILLVTALSLLAVSAFDGLHAMVGIWETKEEYSYGYLIPFISLFLIWQRKNELQRISFTGSWAGVAVTGFGALVFLVGDFSARDIIVQYAFILMLIGLVLSLMGRQAVRVIIVPMLILAFMIPLPEILLNSISSRLQLLSSELGVWVIRLFGISVFLEGNVIDLGAMKLQVVEACSGLRYLFPLMSFGFITAYFFRAPMWQRTALFLSTVPITILMNSFRIGVIGISVEYFGQGAAEGFLHDFEGWIVFMACTVLLFGEMWLFSRFSARRPLRELFNIELPAPVPSSGARIKLRPVPRSMIAAVALMGAVTLLHASLPNRVEQVPQRDDFVLFPLAIDAWHGKNERLQQIFVDSLKLDDYLLADFARDDGAAVNLYSAYYGSQSKDKTTHSPRTCIPGGGWVMSDFAQREIGDIRVNGLPLRVNRTVIQMHDQRQLVYYWFQQRGRVITSEYMVKWYLFWDALTRNRSDGALVRVTTVLRPGQSIDSADAYLHDFLRSAVPQLSRYIPD
jgi:exosortase D (VPLPA-CTERM-specific)